MKKCGRDTCLVYQLVLELDMVYSKYEEKNNKLVFSYKMKKFEFTVGHQQELECALVCRQFDQQSFQLDMGLVYQRELDMDCID